MKNSLFSWSIDTSKNNSHLFVYCALKFANYLLFQALQFIVNMSQYEETRVVESWTKSNGVKKASTRNSRVPDSMKVELEKKETKVEPHIGPSIGTYVTAKKSL